MREQDLKKKKKSAKEHPESRHIYTVRNAEINLLADESLQLHWGKNAFALLRTSIVCITISCLGLMDL